VAGGDKRSRLPDALDALLRTTGRQGQAGGHDSAGDQRLLAYDRKLDSGGVGNATRGRTQDLVGVQLSGFRRCRDA
jgi:hypothetical protein